MVTQYYKPRPSEDAFSLAMHFEQLRLTAYWDVDGYSIGYGHHTKQVAKGLVWSKETALKALYMDMLTASAAVNHACDFALNQAQHDAFCDLVFNIGAHAFLDGHLPEYVKAHKYAEAADLLLEYNHAAGRVLPSLTDRRDAEKCLFTTGHLVPWIEKVAIPLGT